MSWLPAWLLGGIDTTEEQQRNDQLNAQLAALNQDALLSGKYDQSTFNQAEANRQAGNIPDVAGDVQGAFDQSIADNTKSIRDGISSVASIPFKLVPWWAWLVAGAALFFYMGGGIWLKGALKKR